VAYFFASTWPNIRVALTYQYPLLLSPFNLVEL